MTYLKNLFLSLFCSALVAACSNDHDVKKVKVGSSYVEAHFVDSMTIDGLAKYYDSAGGLSNVVTYRMGKREGVSINYYPNKMIRDSVQYISDKESGYWMHYDEKGNLIYGNFFYYGLQFGPELVFENNRLKKFLFSDFNRRVIIESDYSTPGRIDTGFFFNMQFALKTVVFEDKPVFNLFGYLPAIPRTKSSFSIGLTNDAHQDKELTPITGHDFIIDTLLSLPPHGWHYYISCRLKANKDSIDKVYIEEIVH